jgi:hypothetical protein
LVFNSRGWPVGIHIDLIKVFGIAPPYDGWTGQKRTELPSFFQMAAVVGQMAAKAAASGSIGNNGSASAAQLASSASMQESNYLGIG